MMNKLLLVLAFLGLSANVQAQTQVFTTVSSCTYSGASVSSGTWVRRIDNLDKGNAGLQAGRSILKITLPEGAKDIFIGYDSSVSTSPWANAFGRQLHALAGESRTVELLVSDALTIYALAEDSLGNAIQRVSVEQCRTKKTDLP